MRFEIKIKIKIIISNVVISFFFFVVIILKIVCSDFEYLLILNRWNKCSKRINFIIFILGNNNCR